MSRFALVSAEDWHPLGIDGLEDSALEAVKATGNTLVTAGPGAGKTELLGQRGVFLLQTGACAYPRRLLAISFKRDAARNLRERFHRRCKREQAGLLDSMTFDAFAKLLLDRFWRALPEPWNLTKPYRIGRFLNRNEFSDLLRATAGTLSDTTQPAGWAASTIGQSPTSAQVHGVSLDSFNLAIHELVLHPLLVSIHARCNSLPRTKAVLESRLSVSGPPELYFRRRTFLNRTLPTSSGTQFRCRHLPFRAPRSSAHRFPVRAVLLLTRARAARCGAWKRPAEISN
jgi:hypothetical protein